MSPRFASLERAMLETSGATRGKLALVGGFVVVVGLAMSFLLGNPQASRAESNINFKAREVAQLKSLDEGAQGEFLAEGMSAQEKNELIPLSGVSGGKMAGFTAIGQGSGQYGTALKCLTQAVYYEAANEPLAGKRGVAQVVLNRLKHPAYPNSVCGVVYEGVNKPVCQFSFTCDGSLLRPPMASLWKQSQEVARAALAGEVEPRVGSATHYHADYVLPRWAYTLGKIDKIGLHIFYRFPGRAGEKLAFSRQWNGREFVPKFDRDRLRQMLAADLVEQQPAYTPGLTVVPDVADRHAPSDVGGRIDTTKTWRLSIPDPVKSGSTYSATVKGQAKLKAGAAGSAPKAADTVQSGPGQADAGIGATTNGGVGA